MLYVQENQDLSAL